MSAGEPKTVSCPDCDQTVSRLAPSCPHCGRPMEAATQLVEQTAKKYKMIQLVGVGICGLGTVAFALSAACESPVAISLSCLILAVGVIEYAVGRGLAWWHHG